MTDLSERIKKITAVVLVFAVFLSVGIIEKKEKRAQAESEGNYEYDILDDNTAMIIVYTGEEAKVTIPSKLGGIKVTGIENTVFSGYENITSVKIPDTVTYVGEGAFENCANLTSVTLSKNLTDMGDSVFQNCVSLTRITLPSSITSIGDSVFQDCGKLTAVTFSKNLASIGDSAFFGCENLTSVTLPKNLTSIGGDAFHGCNKLTSVTIPDSITVIEDLTFADCEKLTKVTIPASVTEIGDYAFEGCPENLVIVTPAGSYAEEYANAHGIQLSLTKVPVPKVSAVKGVKVTAGKKTLTLQWKKASGITGYQVQVSLKSSFKGAKTVNVKSTAKKYAAKKLKSQKKYYIRIRAYKTYSDSGKSKKACSSWTTKQKKVK